MKCPRCHGTMSVQTTDDDFGYVFSTYAQCECGYEKYTEFEEDEHLDKESEEAGDLDEDGEEE